MGKVSDQIRQAIARCGMTQYRLAKELGVSESALSRFMHGGSIRTDMVDRLGELLGFNLTMTLPKATRDLARSAKRRGDKAEK